MLAVSASNQAITKVCESADSSAFHNQGFYTGIAQTGGNLNVVDSIVHVLLDSYGNIYVEGNLADTLTFLPRK